MNPYKVKKLIDSKTFTCYITEKPGQKMCGRFAQAYDDTALKEKFRLEDVSERIQPRFNLSPGMKVNTVVKNSGKYELKPMMWGFSDLHGKPLPSLIFNSRIETLTGDSHLGQYLIKHRCIIPVTGFYEWSGKQPYFAITKAGMIMSLAGVFTKTEEGYKCSVVTTEAEGPLKKIHHRMPLVLSGEMISLWTGNDIKGQNDPRFREGGSTGKLDIYRVTEQMNSVDFEGEECIAELKNSTLF